MELYSKINNLKYKIIMKKILSLCILAFFLFSCSNDEFDNLLIPESQSKTMLDLASDSVVIISSYEDWFNLFGVEPEILNDELKKSKSILRSSGIDIKTISGYNSVTNTKKYRTIFTPEMAKQLGLYTGRVYQCYMKHVKKILLYQMLL